MVNGRARPAGLQSLRRFAAAPGGERRSAFRLRSRSSSGADADPLRGRVPRAPCGGEVAGGDCGVDGDLWPGAPAGSFAAPSPATPPPADVVRRRAALSLGWKGRGGRSQSLRLAPGSRPALSPPRRNMAASSSFPGGHGLPAPLRRGLQYSESHANSTLHMEDDDFGGGSAGLLAAARSGPPARRASRPDGMVRLESPGDAGSRGNGARRRTGSRGGGGGGALSALETSKDGKDRLLGGRGSARQAGAAGGVPDVGAAVGPPVAVPGAGRRPRGPRPGAGGRGQPRRPPRPRGLRRLLGV